MLKASAQLGLLSPDTTKGTLSLAVGSLFQNYLEKAGLRLSSSLALLHISQPPLLQHAHSLQHPVTFLQHLLHPPHFLLVHQ